MILINAGATHQVLGKYVFKWELHRHLNRGAKNSNFI